MDIYAALLEGAPPHVIQRTVEGQHQQMWKLREHHLVTTDSSDSDSGIELDLDTVNSLNPGDPLDAYFPAGTQIKEYRDGLTVQEPGCDRALRYQRISTIEAQKRDADAVDYVQDIIITGEVGIQKVFCQLTSNTHLLLSQGHSAWGQFSIVGRVRPCDGFVSLCKEYVCFIAIMIVVSKTWVLLTAYYRLMAIGGNGCIAVTSSVM